MDDDDDIASTKRDLAVMKWMAAGLYALLLATLVLVR
jgi:hypothetical protein